MKETCEGCVLMDRRDFLRDVGVVAAGALVALGASPSDASASAVAYVSPIGGSRETKAYAIPAGDGTQIDKANDTMITRWQGKVFVYSLACPHQNTVLRWRDKEGQFECPKHHSRFQADGVYIKDSGRATRGLDRFAVRKDGNNVVADLDKLHREDDDAAAWNAAFITL
jgi:Rieske Fe-S protein